MPQVTQQVSGRDGMEHTGPPTPSPLPTSCLKVSGFFLRREGCEGSQRLLHSPWCVSPCPHAHVPGGLNGWLPSALPSADTEDHASVRDSPHPPHPLTRQSPWLPKLPAVSGERVPSSWPGRAGGPAHRPSPGGIPQAASRLQELLRLHSDYPAGGGRLANVRGRQVVPHQRPSRPGREDPALLALTRRGDHNRALALPAPAGLSVTLWDLPGSEAPPSCSADKYTNRWTWPLRFLLLSLRRCAQWRPAWPPRSCARARSSISCAPRWTRTWRPPRMQRPSGFREGGLAHEIREALRRAALREDRVHDPRVFLVSNLSPHALPTSRCSANHWERDLPAPRHAGLLSLRTSRWRPCRRRKTCSRSRCSDGLVSSSRPCCARAGGRLRPTRCSSARCAATAASAWTTAAHWPSWPSRWANRQGTCAPSCAPMANEVSPRRSCALLPVVRRRHEGGRAFEKDIPGVRGAGGEALSFGTVYTMLQGCLNEMTEDAQRPHQGSMEGRRRTLSPMSAWRRLVTTEWRSGDQGGEHGGSPTLQPAGRLASLMSSWTAGRDLSGQIKRSPYPLPHTHKPMAQKTHQTIQKRPNMVKIEMRLLVGTGWGRLRRQKGGGGGPRSQVH